MAGHTQSKTVGPLPNAAVSASLVPAVLTRLVWLLWLASLGVLAVRLRTGGTWTLSGVVTVDGLTVLLWTAVTFFSGVVHSYSRRYLSGEQRVTRFFVTVFGFTLVVMVLVAAAHLAVFALAWLSMGLLMASLIGHVRDWPQAAAAARLARRYFLASTAALGLALATLWWATGETTVSGVTTAADTVSPTVWFVAAGSLLLAAAIQSALFPFQTWLLSSMTAPTPASALMHAGFVNAGGILLFRFAPVISADAGFMTVVLIVGTASALFGKLAKSVQTDAKRTLGCSTVGQMGFMVAQAGLGFFGAAVAHLVLHGFYKAYQFLAAGTQVTRTTPAAGPSGASTGVGRLAVALPTALLGGALFAHLTGKGTGLDGGLLLTLIVVVTTLHATRNVLGRGGLPATVRYGAIPVVFLPAIAIYAVVYNTVTHLLAGAPVVTAPGELTVVHAVVAVAFLAAYVAVDTGLYRRSDRLYVALVNATRPPADTVLTTTEEYDGV
jgi:NAD(P)H-quinone oxidoreductase subunit 5